MLPNLPKQGQVIFPWMQRNDTACIKISYRDVAVTRATGQGQAGMSAPVLRITERKKLRTMQITFYDTRITGKRRTVLVEEKTVEYETDRLNTPEDAVEMINKLTSLNVLGEEHCYMVAMNNRNRVIGVFFISKGTATNGLVGAREVFMRALLIGAVKIILLHNHPSADCVPSREDNLLTKSILRGKSFIGIHLDDHIIVGGDNYYSFKENGML